MTVETARASATPRFFSVWASAMLFLNKSNDEKADNDDAIVVLLLQRAFYYQLIKLLDVVRTDYKEINDKKNQLCVYSRARV